MAVARVHVRSWQAGYRNLLPQVYLDSLKPEDRAGRYNFASTDPHHPATLVAVEDEEIGGFVTTAPARDPDAQGCGELWALYVDPARWGHGIGGALLTAARGRLLDMGFQKAVLWVMVGNERAERFYRGDQWIPDGSRRTETVWGAVADELRYSRAL
jgi:GNAT superfamily N-acetyltransferase